MPQSEPPSFHIRLPAPLMKRLKIAAAENERSVNAEIAARLEGSFTVSDEAREKLKSLIAEMESILEKG